MTWWQKLYDDDVADLLLEKRSTADNDALAGQLVELLELAPGDRVFDQCCGTGAIAAALLARGIAVTGVDQASGYVERARRRAPGGDFACADASSFVAETACRGAFNWGTSFGYALDDAENQAMLRAAFDSLEPGGLFALDVLALPGVLRGFQKTMVDRAGERLLIRDTSIDLEAGTMNKVWTFVSPSGERAVRRTSIRLYLPHQIAELAAGAGFAIEGVYSGADRAAIDIDSPRCVVLARKPGRRAR